MLDLVVLILVALLVCSNFYWALVCLKLTNRIMSKNYGEFVQAEVTKRPVRTSSVEEDLSDPVAERHAKEMNSLMGVI